MPLSTARNRPPTTGSPSVPTAPPPVVFGQVPVARAPVVSTATPAVPPPSKMDTDLDELARQLFEPVSRLLRADLRQGRERAGRGHDRRR
jgi:syndecan 1